MSGQQLNTNSVKSVSNSSKQGKTRSSSGSKSSRRKSKKKKEQIRFVAIPIQDLEWAWQQQPCVMRLFMQCWASDPYGSRWMVLNHTLSEASFFRAKKIISDRGLFIFKSERSFRNNRERVPGVNFPLMRKSESVTRFSHKLS